ncbi:hypothetical protein G6F61_015131 [Rhizopus arrhizus]|nr:hypothetical protein G6F61_015131 [Rhizopus arrhizus]
MSSFPGVRALLDIGVHQPRGVVVQFDPCRGADKHSAADISHVPPEGAIRIEGKAHALLQRNVAPNGRQPLQRRIAGGFG